jgi:predicted phosphoribosyltransferase
LRSLNPVAGLVLGLPRGGVIVAAEVAAALNCPLDVIVVRKIGHPRHREFAIGALTEDGTYFLNDASLNSPAVDRTELEGIVREETGRLAEYRRTFHRHALPEMRGKSVIIADDGLATGSTMEAAVRTARNLGASRVLVAVPVASDTAVDRIRRVADEVIALLVDPDFGAVGQYYGSFPQTNDLEVLEVLRRANDAHPPEGPLPSRPN